MTPDHFVRRKKYLNSENRLCRCLTGTAKRPGSAQCAAQSAFVRILWPAFNTAPQPLAPIPFTFQMSTGRHLIRLRIVILAYIGYHGSVTVSHHLGENLTRIRSA